MNMKLKEINLFVAAAEICERIQAFLWGAEECTNLTMTDLTHYTAAITKTLCKILNSNHHISKFSFIVVLLVTDVFACLLLLVVVVVLLLSLSDFSVCLLYVRPGFVRATTTSALSAGSVTGLTCS